MLTKEDIQKAIRISKAIEKYLQMSGETMMRSTDVYEYLARQGLVPRDRHQGIKLRQFLNHLKRENALHLIPQCDGIPQNEIFTNWYFHSAREKMTKTIIVRKEKTQKENFTKEDSIKILRKLAAGLDPETNDTPTNPKFFNQKAIREALIFAVDYLECDKVSEKLITRYKRDETPELNPAKLESPVSNTPKVEKYTIPTSPGKTKRLSAERLPRETRNLMVHQCKATINSLGLVKTNDSFPEHIQTIRLQYRRAYEPWTEEEDEILKRLFAQTRRKRTLIDVFQRQEGAIIARLKKLHLID